MTPERERWLLFTLAGIQFNTALDFMVIMPLGPLFTQIFGIHDGQFALLVSAYTLASGLSGVAAAFFIDRYGRKHLLLVLYALFGLAAWACSMAPGYEALVLGRIAAGATGGVISSVIQTIVADVIPFERRGRAMGTVMSSFSFASALGLPASLWLAGHGGWHAPFMLTGIVSLGMIVLVAATLPRLDQHLAAHPAAGVWAHFRAVLSDVNHWRAFAFTGLMVFSGFVMIPFLAINAQHGVGLRQDQIPYIYLCGGVASLFTARWFGRLTDRIGKVPAYRRLTLGLLPALFVVALLPYGAPLSAMLLVSTWLMVLMSGRMIPGMAITGGAASPAHRGTFMTLNSAVQSAAMGIAALVGGLLIQRRPDGRLQDFWIVAAVASAAMLATLGMASRLQIRQPKAA
ncbi:MAG: hypothetical protein RLZZ126_993 [Pseudomonadota bacterium]|jgi:predicted MFS family arabinose efflux permease